MKTIKKMSKGGSLKDVPAGKVGLGKLPTEVRNKMGYKKYGGATAPKKKMGGPIKKAQMGVEKTKDSTAIFQNKAKDMARKSLYAESKGDKKLSDIYIEVASKASSDAARQKLKGKPGYDKNGYAIKKMGGAVPKGSHKMPDGKIMKDSAHKSSKKK